MRKRLITLILGLVFAFIGLLQLLSVLYISVSKWVLSTLSSFFGIFLKGKGENDTKHAKMLVQTQTLVQHPVNIFKNAF